jgi:hypothetical protein
MYLSSFHPLAKLALFKGFAGFLLFLFLVKQSRIHVGNRVAGGIRRASICSLSVYGHKPYRWASLGQFFVLQVARAAKDGPWNTRSHGADSGCS